MLMLLGLAIGIITFLSWLLVKVTGVFCGILGSICEIARQISSNSNLLYPVSAFLIAWGMTKRWYAGIAAALVTAIIYFMLRF
jgi:hypothetical protein